MEEQQTFVITYIGGDTETVTPTIADMFKASRHMKADKAGTFGEDGLETTVYLMYYAHKRVSGDTRDFDVWVDYVQSFTMQDEEAGEAPKADF